MKHIKLYEQNKSKTYWLIPLDDRLEIALGKIKAPVYFIIGRQETRKRNAENNYKFRYIMVSEDTKGHIWNWDWWSFDLNLEKYCERKGYIWGGNVNIPDYELEANKYNL
jgi:hypothetical protein